MASQALAKESEIVYSREEQPEAAQKDSKKTCASQTRVRTRSTGGAMQPPVAKGRASRLRLKHCACSCCLLCASSRKGPRISLEIEM